MTPSNAAQPVLYVAWDEHMMFCAPLAVTVDPGMHFARLVSDLLPTLYGEHPDFAHVDWPKVQWFRDSQLFTPQPSGTLADHGFAHQSVLRWRTPGLEGIRGSCG